MEEARKLGEFLLKSSFTLCRKTLTFVIAGVSRKLDFIVRLLAGYCCSSIKTILTETVNVRISTHTVEFNSNFRIKKNAFILEKKSHGLLLPADNTLLHKIFTTFVQSSKEYKQHSF